MLLADEVGLGKTIEAALVMTQRWWEDRRRVLLIAPAALRVATEHHAKPTGGKPWRYALIPDDAIQPSATLAGLLASYTVPPDIDMLGRYLLTEAA